MTLPGTVELEVTQERHIGEARRTAAALADAAACSSPMSALVALAVSELAGNLFFHTDRGGAITVQLIDRDDRRGVEIVAQDEGPGIADVADAMRDGFTTNGGLGGGLPGVERLMDEFEIDSEVGVGTRIVCRKWWK